MRSFFDVEDFVAETLRALARGDTSVVVPRRFRMLPTLRALSPRRLGALLARTKLAALPESTRPGDSS
jgi:hypothetical protein